MGGDDRGDIVCEREREADSEPDEQRQSEREREEKLLRAGGWKRRRAPAPVNPTPNLLSCRYFSS